MATEFDTRTIAGSTTISAADLTIQVNGYSVAGDGGAALYKRLTDPPSPAKPWHFHSNNGTTWWELAEVAVNPVMIGCKGNGTDPDSGVGASNPFEDMLNAFKDVALPSGRVFLIKKTMTITNAGLTLRGPGAIKLKSDDLKPQVTGAQILIQAANVTIGGVTFVADNCYRALVAQVLNPQRDGTHFTVRNCHFSGNCNNYIYTSSIGTTVQTNVFDCESAEYLTTPVVLTGSDGRNHLCADNTFIEVFGFGVQAVGSSDPENQQPRANTGLRGVVIRNNRFINSIIELSLPLLTQPEPSFTVSAPRRVNRWTIYINGIASRQDFDFPDGDKKLPGSGPFTFNKKSGSVPAGAKVQFKFWRSLESVNINRDCHGVLVDGNVISGSGDSGIVLCNDKIILDPDDDNQNYFGWPPDGIVVTNNVISETAYAGCSETVSIDGVSYIGNCIRDYSLAVKDAAYSSGIMTTGGQSTISGNVITGNGTTTRLGICLNGVWVAATPYTGANENCADQADGLISYTAGDNIVGGNVFPGSFVIGKCGIPQASVNSRRQGAVFSDMPYQDYFGQLDTSAPLIGGLPPVTPFLSFSKSPGAAAGWTAETGDVPWTGATAFKISGANRVNMFLTDRSVLADTVMRVEFWAKTLSGTSYVGIIAVLASQPRIVNLPITATTWQRYTILFPIPASFVGDPIIIRHGTDAGQEGLICGLHVSYQAVPI
jgi:hypothetical protein